MRTQEATTTVTAPVAEVERFLTDVEQWPRFLVGLDAATRVSHERWVFCVHDGNDRREATVAVRRDAAGHRFTWRSLDGPVYSGCLALTPVDGRHTRVHLELRWHPGTFLAALAEMVLPRGDRAARDLRELEGALAAR